MNDCFSRNQILRVLSQGWGQADDLRAHVESCEACRSHFTQAAAAFRLATGLEAFTSGAGGEISSDVAERLLARLQPLFAQLTSPTDGCPDEETLLAMVLGAEDVGPDIPEHIKQCLHCEQIVARLRSVTHVLEDYQGLISDSDESIPKDASQRIFERASTLYRQSIPKPKDCPDRARL